MTRRPVTWQARTSTGFAAISLAAASALVGGLATAPRASAAVQGTVTRAESVSRTHLINGADSVVDQRNFSVSLDTTRNLRDRQGINITWKGAHPTGGIVFDVNKPHAAEQEYPVVVLQCRGVDSTSVPGAQRLSQQTCFTSTPDTRYQGPYRGLFPSYRLDRYATPAERKASVGAPSPIPTKCLDGTDAQRWIPFTSIDRTTYAGGYTGCAGLAPEQSVLANPLSPSNATFGTTDTGGSGAARFIVQDAQDNASLGCSDTVACSLVIIPIMGISCDAAAAALPAEDRPASGDLDADQAACTKTGFYQPGQPNGNQSASDPNSVVAVSGELWWSASNWRNRISVPLTFAQTAATCDVVGGGAPTNIYGSQYLLQATQQWAPTFCRDPKLFRLQHTQTSEVQAKNLLATGVTSGQYLGVKAAFQAGPPQSKFSNPIVQAPTTVSGFALGYVMDDAKGHRYTKLKLDARLLAKLLTMSYPALPAIRDDWAGNDSYSKYKPASSNPLDMSVDPEFLALNPGMKASSIAQLEASSTLFSMSSDSDVMTALTSYIDADPEARAWLDGAADPWGMMVNPSYAKIGLPVTSWPQLDTYYNPLGNACIADGHVAYLPLVAGPVSDPSQITFNMQFGIGNSQVNCLVTGDTDSPGNRRLAALGPQQPGIRFLLGVVSLADANRYAIDTAALQTHKSDAALEKPTDDAGRSFAAPTNAGLLAAAKLLRPNDTLGTWTLPYDTLCTDAAGKDAYPGTLLLSTDVPTAGLTSLDADHYAKFLDFVAGPGQVPGAGNGQLPSGYLPITKADGLGDLVAYTSFAADSVRQQRGFVPKPSGPAAPPVAAPGTTPTKVPLSPGVPDTSGPSGSPSGSQPAGSTSTPSGLGSTSGGKVSSPGTKVSMLLPEVALRPTGVTASVPRGWSTVALPVLVLVALVSGVLALLTSRIGRR